MKNLILAAVAVFTFGAATAQDMKFGVKAGLNLANTTADGAAMKVGGNFGVFGDFKVSDKFSVQPEILYSMQGAKASTTLSGGGFTLTDDRTQSLGYINIPVMGKFYATKDLSLQFGPQIGFLMTVKEEVVQTSNNQTFYPNSTTSSTDKTGYNSVDFGLNFGVGYNITEKFMVDLRYNLGLNGIEKNLAPNQTATKNRVLSVNFGYSF